MKLKLSLKQITRMALFSSLFIAVQLAIPSLNLPIISVPFTMQTLMVMVISVILSPGESSISVLLYLLIGALGLPVFNGYQGGFDMLIGPTSGFLWAFPIAAFLIGQFKGKSTFVRLLIINVLFGMFLVYLLGAISLSIHQYLPYGKALWSLSIFIPLDLIKALIASLIGSKVEKISKKLNF
ncbi:MAG: biotin transporter BioY [Bacilli bacterium]|nr:biotin transporter BioY [Bacilli bacterium]